MLSEQRRKQLDGIVQQMVTNKENDKNIQWVVDDFSKKYGNEQQVQPQQKPSILKTAGDVIAGGKAGQNIAQAGYTTFQTVKGLLVGGNTINDTQKMYMDNGNKLLELANKQTDPQMKLKYAKMASEMFSDGGGVPESIIGGVRTLEQQIGDAIGLGANLATAGGIGASSKLVKPGVGIVKGAMQGAKSGALVGAGYGAVQGTAQGLQNNQGVRGTIGAAAMGTVAGATGGALLGGATGAVSGGIRAVKTGKSIVSGNDPLQKIQEMISPKPTIKQARLAQSEGRLIKGKDPTLFRGGTEDIVLPSRDTLKASQTIQKYIPKASNMNEAQLYVALENNTGEIARKLVPNMKSTPVTRKAIDKTTNAWNELRKLQMEDAPATSEANVLKLQTKFESILDKRLGKEDLNMNDIWYARQVYDSSIKESVKQATHLSPEVLQLEKEIWLQNRSILNGMINDISTGLGSRSKQAFADMSSMYDAKEGILSKAKINKKIQQSKLVQLIKKHPILSSLIGGGTVYGATKKVGIPLP